MSTLLERLSANIKPRDLDAERDTLMSKWGKTGLLEGLRNDHEQVSMAILLENQTKELIREATTMAAGDVEGFASVAFPIVRRVFGSLIANDLVAVQPMSLPAGLIFFMDFTFTNSRLDTTADTSLYGGGKVAKGIADGVSLTGDAAEQSFYALNNGYASPTSSSVVVTIQAVDSGTLDGSDRALEALCRWDADLRDQNVAVGRIATSSLTAYNPDNLIGITLTTPATGSQVRRLSDYSGSAKGHVLVFLADPTETAANLMAHLTGGIGTASYPLKDNFVAGGAIGSVVGTTPWGLENQTAIPEIDIKIDSISVTAITKKLKAKWTPELGQDLNAFHNLDAEVELTSILSEQIALEIDREVLFDLVTGATAGTYYWSRRPGKFVNRSTGASLASPTAPPDFTGTVSEWYETLVETINDVSAQIHRKVLRGGATFLVVSPEVANVLEMTHGFRANVTHDDDRGDVGTFKSGTMSKKWDIYVDPYFPRNVILVGRKGSSFLESGFVYAPYVPLQVTPTIFGIEDFVPRKGVMTRYAKKMVRPDMYGLVIVEDLLG